ncbi:hypothetical protein GCM10011579_076950 [Streptomyces albiflavescens]|uniref:Uncharacterized protein n=1 Tax=Streptomyces albiflavescens TaxID=1623582 RepID=A0A918D9C4_9ACTN|nr:hypothetical protein GCM10011579_076950 [Streptomyces albiflavescens]
MGLPTVTLLQGKHSRGREPDMADRYLSFTGTAPGRFLTRRLGLPQPTALLGA